MEAVSDFLRQDLRHVRCSVCSKSMAAEGSKQDRRRPGQPASVTRDGGIFSSVGTAQIIIMNNRPSVSIHAVATCTLTRMDLCGQHILYSTPPRTRPEAQSATAPQPAVTDYSAKDLHPAAGVTTCSLHRDLCLPYLHWFIHLNRDIFYVLVHQMRLGKNQIPSRCAIAATTS
jgi:hypothetical protein